MNEVKNLKKLIYLIILVTSLEVMEGILSNKDLDRKCLLIIREIECNDETKKKLEKARFFNENENDNIELENIKINAKERLPQKNVFNMKVIQI